LIFAHALLEEANHMNFEVVTPPGVSPAAPFSLGIKANGFLFVSGQTGREGGTGNIPEGITAQTRVCLDNVKRIVEAGGSSMDRVVKVTVFLTDMKDFAQMNEVYRTYFSTPPTRSTVGVNGLARPEFVVEIEAVALL
jgi:2-iminobutanoate/2-iminopropanoate deaminase